MKNTKTGGRLAAVILAFVMALSMLPTHRALAEGGESGGVSPAGETFTLPVSAAEAETTTSAALTLRWSDTVPGMAEWEALPDVSVTDYQVHFYQDSGGGYKQLASWGFDSNNNFSATDDGYYAVDMRAAVTSAFARSGAESADNIFTVIVRGSDGAAEPVDSPVYTYERPAQSYGQVTGLKWDEAKPYSLTWNPVSAVGRTTPAYIVSVYGNGERYGDFTAAGTSYDISRYTADYNTDVTYSFQVLAYSEMITEAGPGPFSESLDFDWSAVPSAPDVKPRWSDTIPGVIEWELAAGTTAVDYRYTLYGDLGDGKGFVDFASRGFGTNFQVSEGVMSDDMRGIISDRLLSAGATNIALKFTVTQRLAAQTTAPAESPVYNYAKPGKSFAKVTGLSWDTSNPYLLKWNPVDEVDGAAPIYMVNMYRGDSNNYSVRQWNITATSVNVSGWGLEPSETYTFNVFAYGEDIEKVAAGMLSDKSPVFNENRLPELPAPKNLGWEKLQGSIPSMSLTWDALPAWTDQSGKQHPGAEIGKSYRYSIELYRGNVRTFSTTRTIGVRMAGSGRLFMSDPFPYYSILQSGEYRFRVKLLYSGSLNQAVNSQWSDWSPAFVFDKDAVSELSEPANLRWDPDSPTTAVWDPVPNAGGYYVQLMRVSSTSATDTDVNSSANYVSGSAHFYNSMPYLTSVDFARYMNEKLEYTFRVRALSADLSEYAHGSHFVVSGKFYDLTEASDFINSELDKLENSQPSAVLDALTAMDTGELAAVIQSDAEALEKIRQLEEKYSEGTGIATKKAVDEKGLGFGEDDVNVIGAAFNALGNEITLDIKKKETDKNDLAEFKQIITVSMDLLGARDSRSLDVPVRITLPVPAGFDWRLFHIIHISSIDGKRESVPLSFNETKTKVSFTLTSFSDFLFVEDKETVNPVPDTPSGSGPSSSADGAYVPPVASQPVSGFVQRVRSLLANTSDVTIDLGNDDTMILDGGTFGEIISKNASLAVKKGRVSLTLTPEAIEKLELRSAAKTEISLVPVAGLAVEGLLENAYDIVIKADGNEVTDLGIPLQISFELRPSRLSGRQRLQTVGVRIAEDKVTNLLVGDWKGNTFSFHTSSLSRYGVVSDPGLVKVNMRIDSRVYDINGTERLMDTAPFLSDGNTMIPVRFIAEAIGAGVDWNAGAQTVVINLDNRLIGLRLGENAPGTDIAPLLQNDRVYIPLRYVAEQLGGNVIWNESLKSITVYR